MDDGGLSGAVAIVTGAGGGIGSEVVALARERFGGLDVVVNNAGRFLLKPISPAASFMTGAVVMADGGFTAQ
jgi:NAD(P)-dependent dehydrogenase (short-subunit alcohol dehydrogenase family)